MFAISDTDTIYFNLVNTNQEALWHTHTQKKSK